MPCKVRLTSVQPTLPKALLLENGVRDELFFVNNLTCGDIFGVREPSANEDGDNFDADICESYVCGSRFGSNCDHDDEDGGEIVLPIGQWRDDDEGREEETVGPSVNVIYITNNVFEVARCVYLCINVNNSCSNT